MKKIATIPLYASRNNVLPGDSRWFTGLMSQPLPAGQYKMRAVFSSEKSRSQIIKDAELAISDDLATTWAKNVGSENTISKLTFDPAKVDLKLNPGRTTSANFQVKNRGMDTIAANCKIAKSENDWLQLKSSDFTLAPNGNTSLQCIIKVPDDAQPGAYNWTVLIEMEKSGLESDSKTQAVQYTVPISVIIDENSKAVSKN
jgi:uncharacterized membrane protein